MEALLPDLPPAAPTARRVAARVPRAGVSGLLLGASSATSIPA